MLLQKQGFAEHFFACFYLNVFSSETRKLRNSFVAIGCDTRFCLHKQADNFEQPVNSHSNIDCGVLTFSCYTTTTWKNIPYMCCCLLKLIDLRMISAKTEGKMRCLKGNIHVCNGLPLSQLIKSLLRILFQQSSLCDFILSDLGVRRMKSFCMNAKFHDDFTRLLLLLLILTV